MKLTKEQELWLKTLESGKYKQGRGKLRKKGDPLRESEDVFCCLGVACDLYDAGMWTFKENKNRCMSKFYHYMDIAALLPQEVIGYLNVNKGEAKITKLDLISDEDKMKYRIGELYNICLSDLNDHGFTFKNIAKFIRKYPECVFSKGAAE